MSRNKYPEETRQLILDVSTRLFLTKGYEKTSLQDIINELGGLTKGAIYHHFKSKEDILIAVIDNMTKGKPNDMLSIANDKTLNGKEKIEKMFSSSIKNPMQEDAFSVSPNLLDNPTFLFYYIKIVVNEVVPFMIPVVKEGIEDGSIHAEYPEELADALMFMSNIWVNPLIFKMDEESLIRRAIMINSFFKPFGLDIFDEDSIDALQKYRKISANKDDERGL